MLNLKNKADSYHAAAAPSSELLPWMLQVADNMILNKDGSLMAAYAFTGEDVEGLTETQSEHISEVIERALRQFDERIILWWTVDRRRTFAYPDGNFDDPISQFVNDKWKADFHSRGQYTNKHYLSVVFRKTDGLNGFMDKVEYFSTKENLSTVKSLWEAAKASILNRNAFAIEQSELDAMMYQFSELIGNFEDACSSLKMINLKGNDLLSFLHDRANPASAGQQVIPSGNASYLDSRLPDNTMIVGKDVMKFSHVDDCYVAAASIKDWPAFSVPGMLDTVMAIPGEITLSQCFMIEEPRQAQAFIEKVRRNNLNASKSFKSYISEAISGKETARVDEGRMHKAAEANEALTGLTGNGDIYGHYNISLIAYGNSRDVCEGTLRHAMRRMGDLGYITVREKMHLLSAWAGSMPGQWGEVVRWFYLNTKNLADLAPLRTISSGSIINSHLSEQAGTPQPALTALPTEYSTPYYFNFHTTDLSHTFVVGPAGNGKTVFVNFLISQFRKYRPSKAFIFDKDYSARIPTLLQGGRYIDMTGDSQKIKLNPFAYLDDKSTWPFLYEWLEMILSSRLNHQISSEDMGRIKEGIEKIAESPREQWRLMSLLPFISSELAGELTNWIEGGQFDHFDNVEDGLSLSDFTAIEMGGLFDSPHLARAFMSYAFFRIQRELDGTTPVIIYIEEAWFMLEDEVFSNKMRDWLKTLRKRLATLILATQSLDDMSSSDIFSTIIDNMPNKIFLPNANAFAHDDLYKHKFGLNNEQIKRIQSALPKRQYYLVTANASRMLEVPFPKPVLSVFRSDGKAQTLLNSLYKENSNDWKHEYLEKIGANE